VTVGQVRLAAVLVVVWGAGSLATAAPAQEGAAAPEWRHYAGGLHATRYSPLELIDRTNVGDLRIAWRFPLRNFGPRPELKNAATPIMVGGVLYTTAGMTRSVVAIDAGTGELLWMWRMPEGRRFERAPRKNSGRGVAYWTDGAGDERIFVATPGFHLVALDARSGRQVRSFGEDGVVDLMVGLRGPVGAEGDIGSTSPPLVVGDRVIVGPAHAVSMRPRSKRNTKGDVRAFDARTGELSWTFHTVPEPGEFGYDTWEAGAAEYTGNAGVWAPMSADPDRGTVYLPVEAPTSDYYGGERPGDNLFGNSLVCLDFETGRRVWHAQLIHHDVWDWDNPTAPILLDVAVDGRPVEAVIQLTKQGWAYAFDRGTGEPLWPLEERPVPSSDVPGERTSPTQPFPTRPPPYERQGIGVDDLIDFTPELQAEALEVVSEYRLGEIFTPPSLRDAADGTRGTLMLPGALGGANWEGGAADPETGVLYVGSMTAAALRALGPYPERSDVRYSVAAGRVPGVRRLPLVRPPWGRVTAIDMNAGEHLWQMASGDTPETVREHPDLQGVELPRTGKASRAGLLVTRTLLLAGEGWGGGPVFRAHDKATGEILAEIELPAAQTGLPMTYEVGGRQFIAMTVGGDGRPAELVALSLPVAQ